MKYPINFPLSKLFAQFGATLIIKIEFCFDSCENVFVATSTDIPGLVVEAETFVELKNEVEEAIHNLLILEKNKPVSNTYADVVFKDHIAIA